MFRGLIMPAPIGSLDRGVQPAEPSERTPYAGDMRFPRVDPQHITRDPQLPQGYIGNSEAWHMQRTSPLVNSRCFNALGHRREARCNA
jgi:hypothetical protein